MSKITNIRRNCMGTVSFDGLFSGMRKPQTFDVYPINAQSDKNKILVQSDTRIGYINLWDSLVSMCPPRASGAHNDQLCNLTVFSMITKEECFMLRSQIMATASGNAGTHGVYCDNSGALEVFTESNPA
jgi:hypothetical protein